MKTTLILAAAVTLALVSAHDGPPHYETPRRFLQCSKEMNINSSFVDETVDADGAVKLENLPVIRDLYICVFQRNNYIVNGERFDFKRFSEAIGSTSRQQEELVEKSLIACKSDVGSNANETVVKMIDCLIDKKAFP